MSVLLPTNFQSFIHVSRYARYIDELKRRETWEETVNRYIQFFKTKLKTDQIPWDELQKAILNLEVMPSMRCMMTAGEALERDNVAAYNCAYVTIDSPRSFDEIMFVLMCGTGMGYSVESRYVNKLPEIPSEFHETETTIVFHDSKLGWAKGFKEFLSLLWAGQVAKFDVSNLRPAGARLKTFGGRASGPEPLVDLLRFVETTFRKAAGRKLTTIECHDVVCKIADIVVCGGVRRSALICLSDLNDDHIRHAKSGDWWKENPQRALANNSAVYEQKPTMAIFMKEWMALYESRSGERGIFSRQASQQQASRYERRDATIEYGTNPCSEIILRPYQFCNLSEIIVRADDTFETLKRKAEIATILGTLQSTLSDFRYLRKQWQTNTEEERLLGVSMTGICDNKALITPGPELEETLDKLRKHCTNVNIKYAKILKISPSTAITCGKPSGTVSQLTDTASGIHPRYAPYYIRRVRADKKDPMAAYMITHGFEAEEDFYNKSAWVFSFPVKAPEGSITTKDVTAIDQLKLWQVYNSHWCDHKPSITVFVDEHEWLDVGAWVYNHIDEISGVSFLPRDLGSYRQAPFEEIDEHKYKELLAKSNQTIDWTGFSEETDNTEGSQDLACSAGVCAIS